MVSCTVISVALIIEIGIFLWNWSSNGYSVIFGLMLSCRSNNVSQQVFTFKGTACVVVYIFVLCM